MKRTIGLCVIIGVAAVIQSGCVAVKAYEREKLADPLLERENQFGKQTLEQKFFATREGSIGGAVGIGGGCGCAK